MVEAAQVQDTKKKLSPSDMAAGRVARELRRGELTVELFERAESLADPRLYTILWNLCWELADEYAESTPEQRVALKRATAACGWDDSRATQKLVKNALKTQNHDEFERTIRILQRRGDKSVLKASVALTQEGSPQARLMGTRILGRLGLPGSPWASKAVEALAEMESRSVHALLDATRAVIGKIPEELTDEPALELARERIAKSAVSEVRELIEGTVYLSGVINSVDGLMSAIETQLLMIKAAAVRGIARYEALVQDAIEELRVEQKEQEATIPAKRAAKGMRKRSTAASTGKKKTSPVPPMRKRTQLRWAGGGAVAAALVAVAVGALALNSGTDYLDGMDTSSHLGHWDKPSAEIAFAGQAAREVLAKRKSCWMLYHRTEIESAARMVAGSQGGVKAASYDNLVTVLGDAVGEKQYNPVSLFVSYVGFYNGKVASQIIQGLLSETGYFSRDDLVRYIGGIIQESSVSKELNGKHAYSPILRRLDPGLRWRMANILRSGWLSEEDRGLEKHLRSLAVPKWAEVEGLTPSEPGPGS